MEQEASFVPRHESTDWLYGRLRPDERMQLMTELIESMLSFLPYKRIGIDRFFEATTLGALDPRTFTRLLPMDATLAPFVSGINDLLGVGDVDAITPESYELFMHQTITFDAVVLKATKTAVAELPEESVPIPYVTQLVTGSLFVHLAPGQSVADVFFLCCIDFTLDVLKASQ